jgi:hypothetical protein
MRALTWTTASVTEQCGACQARNLLSLAETLEVHVVVRQREDLSLVPVVKGNLPWAHFLTGFPLEIMAVLLHQNSS